VDSHCVKHQIRHLSMMPCPPSVQASCRGVLGAARVEGGGGQYFVDLELLLCFDNYFCGGSVLQNRVRPGTLVAGEVDGER